MQLFVSTVKCKKKVLSGLVLCHIDPRRFIMLNRFLYIYAVLFQTIEISIRIVVCLHRVKCQNSYISTMQLSKNTQFSSIWSIEMTRSGVTTPGQGEPGSDGNKGILHIPQSSWILETSTSDSLVSYPGHSLEMSYPSAEMPLVYFAASAYSTTLGMELLWTKVLDCVYDISEFELQLQLNVHLWAKTLRKRFEGLKPQAKC